MPSRSKRTPTIIVRPIQVGARTPTKTVLGTMTQLNRHAPACDEHVLTPSPSPSNPFPPPPASPKRNGADAQKEVAAHLYKEEEAIKAKPWRWKRHYLRPIPHQWVPPRGAGRNATAADKEWASADYLSGRAIGPERECESDEEERWEEWPAEESGRDGRVEVDIMAIAKVAKRRGAAKEFEMVETVPRVIALEDVEDCWGSDWESELEYEGSEVDGWKKMSECGEAAPRISYATVVQKAPG